MSNDDGCDGSGPFECGGFFYDVLPWWHLISPLFLIFVVGPLLRYGLSQRGEWSGWASLAGRHASAWPGDAVSLGTAQFCRMRRRGYCPQKLDNALHVGAAPGALCLEVKCCAAFSKMPPLVVPWRSIRDAGAVSQPCVAAGELVLDEDEDIVLTFDLYAAVLASCATGGGAPTATVATAQVAPEAGALLELGNVL